MTAINSRLLNEQLLTQSTWPIRVGAAMQQVDQRVNAYDQAVTTPKTLSLSNEDSFTHHWAFSSGKWAARSSLGRWVDGDVGITPNRPLTNPFLQKALHYLEPHSQGAENYYDVLGIKDFTWDKPAEGSWYQFLKNKEDQKEILQTIHDNFSGLKTITAKKWVPWHFLKKTIYAENIKGLVEPLQEGKVTTLFARLGGYLFCAWDILAHTQEYYLAAKAKENGTYASKLKTLKSTLTHFIGFSLRTALCWEAATLGFIVGGSLICIGGLPTLFAGWITGGLFSTITYKLLSKITHKLLDTTYLPGERRPPSTRLPVAPGVVGRGAGGGGGETGADFEVCCAAN